MDTDFKNITDIGIQFLWLFWESCGNTGKFDIVKHG